MSNEVQNSGRLFVGESLMLHGSRCEVEDVLPCVEGKGDGQLPNQQISAANSQECQKVTQTEL